MDKNKFLRSLYIILPILFVAVLGSVFVQLGMDWFNSLMKPSQWVPNILIPIVWTIIYITFAVILVMWQNKQKIPLSTIILLIINGVLNIAWCLVFFTLKQTLGGNVVIIFNLIAGFVLILNIAKSNKLYSYILMIYPIWLSIATTFNLALWILN